MGDSESNAAYTSSYTSSDAFRAVHLIRRLRRHLLLKEKATVGVSSWSSHGGVKFLYCNNNEDALSVPKREEFTWPSP